MIKKIINLTLAVIFCANTCFAWGNNYRSDNSYGDTGYSWEKYKADTGYRLPVREEKSFWQKTGDFFKNTYTAIKNFTVKTYNWTASVVVRIGSFAKDITHKIVNFFHPPNAAVSVQRSAVGRGELRSPESTSSEKQNVKSDDKNIVINQDTLKPRSNQISVENIENIRTDKSAAPDTSRFTLPASRSDDTSNIPPTLTPNPQAINNEDMVHFERVKMEQLPKTNNTSVAVAPERQRFEIKNGQLNYNVNRNEEKDYFDKRNRFIGSGDKKLYDPYLFDNKNGTATVDMPLEWFSPVNAGTVAVGTIALTAGVSIASGPAAIITFTALTTTAVASADNRWTKTIKSGIDDLAAVVNSNKFQIVEVPGVNSEGLKVSELTKIKDSLNLKPNQQLIILHSAGTELGARTLAQIDTTNKEVFVLFLSPRMNYKQLKKHIDNSSISYDHIMSVNSARDCWHWTNMDSLESFKSISDGYLLQKNWKHVFLTEDTKQGFFTNLGHGSAIDGLADTKRRFTYEDNQGNKHYLKNMKTIVESFIRSTND